MRLKVKINQLTGGRKSVDRWRVVTYDLKVHGVLEHDSAALSSGIRCERNVFVQRSAIDRVLPHHRPDSAWNTQDLAATVLVEIVKHLSEELSHFGAFGESVLEQHAVEQRNDGIEEARREVGAIEAGCKESHDHE